MVRRWHQLPLDHALSYAGPVRALVQSLADQVAAATGARDAEVPDLGPATLMDQLTVMVYDASTAVAGTAVAGTADAGRDALTSSPALALGSTLADDLASLRRELR